jgi:hypothetical protein
MIRKTLEKMRRIFNEDYSNTITAMSNLAVTLRNQGQLKEVARMKKEVLEKRRRILSEDHPDTISALMNLTITLAD